jgi:hypothetical protein
MQVSNELPLWFVIFIDDDFQTNEETTNERKAIMKNEENKVWCMKLKLDKLIMWAVWTIVNRSVNF